MNKHVVTYLFLNEDFKNKSLNQSLKKIEFEKQILNISFL